MEIVSLSISQNDTVKLRVFDYVGGSLKLEKTNPSGAHSDPTNGKTRFTIGRTDITDTLTDFETTWVYDVRRIQAPGDEAVHVAGDFIVQLGVGG